MTNEQIRFAMIGGGWRAEFFLRITRALPDRFALQGVLVRDPAKGRAMEKRWRVPTYRTLDDLLGACDPQFVVTSVSWQANPLFLRALADRGMPALSETPPAPDLSGLREMSLLAEGGARIQVAEQYIYQPLHAARLAFIKTGALGTVSQAQVSAAHGYHGISLIRRFLGITFENARITARQFDSSLIAGPTKLGPPLEERSVTSTQRLAWLEYEGKLGEFDFTGDQYWSWVRRPRLLVRGERGEIVDNRAVYLRTYREPVDVEFRRVNAGEDVNHEGYDLMGITVGERWVYRNPFFPKPLTEKGRLADDEIAVASSLVKMAEYVGGGPPVYSLAEACQDHYFGLMIQRAIETGETVVTETQPWAGHRAQ